MSGETKFEDMGVEQLQQELRKRRKVIVGTRKEMDVIEAALEPKIHKRSADEKLRRAGLSRRELQALSGKGEATAKTDAKAKA